MHIFVTISVDGTPNENFCHTSTHSRHGHHHYDDDLTKKNSEDDPELHGGSNVSSFRSMTDPLAYTRTYTDFNLPPPPDTTVKSFVSRINVIQQIDRLSSRGLLWVRDAAVTGKCPPSGVWNITASCHGAGYRHRRHALAKY